MALATAYGELQVPRFATIPPTKDVRGNVAAMALYAGTSVTAVTERRPARDIVLELCDKV